MPKVLEAVEMGQKWNLSRTLVVTSCAECGVHFAIPAPLESECRADRHKRFYCPNGHSLHYPGKSEAEKERERVEALQEQLDEQRRRTTAERELREHAERKLVAQKGATTKARKRHAAGVCPCCNRTFQQLARHMKSQHPGYDPAA